MIDIRFLRENPDAVKENIRKKFQDAKLPLVDEVIALDEESRKTQAEADDLRSKRNKVSKQIGALMGQGKKEEAEKVKAPGQRRKRQRRSRQRSPRSTQGSRSLSRRRQRSRTGSVRSCW